MTKRSQAAILASSAVVLLTSVQLLAADQQRTRTVSDNRVQVAKGMVSSEGVAPPFQTGVASSQPRSVAEFYKLLQDGGASLTGGPMLFQPAGKVTHTTSFVSRDGRKNHPREPLPCGIYTDSAQFEAEQGPFSRGLGNLEDFELTNAGANSLCIIDSPESVDCTSSGADPTGFFCAGPAVDAGDILTGIKIDSTPARGAGWWEGLMTGSGFNGHASKGFHYNYFGDTGTWDLLYTAAPVGCERIDPNPNVAGATFWTFDGNGSTDVEVTLTNGTVVEHHIDGLDSAGVFVGFCCNDGIEKVTWKDAQAAGVDDLKWGTNLNPCPESFPPITLDDIHEGLDILELKLDNFDCGGSNSGPTSGS